MKLRAMLVGFSALLLFGVSACSTGSSAQKSDDTKTNKQAQTEESKETDEADDSGDKKKKSSAKDGDMKKKKKEKMRAMCPMKVDGTTTRIEKLEDAVAIDFTTTEGDVAELRTRIQKMAKWHGKRRGKMNKGDRGKKKGEKHKLKKLMVKSTVETEEIEDGMRMKFSPKNPDHLGALHDHMKSHSDRIAKGKGCPMKMMKGKEAKGG